MIIAGAVLVAGALLLAIGLVMLVSGVLGLGAGLLFGGLMLAVFSFIALLAEATLRQQRAYTAAAAATAVMVFGLGLLFRPSNDPPPTMGQYHAMCAKPRPFPQAAARSDTPPRPVFVDDLDASTPMGGDPDVWHPTDPTTVQLVACVTTAKRGEHHGACTYKGDGGTYTMNYYDGIYTISVYQARSGELLARTGGIRTKGHPPTSCSPSVTLPDDHTNDKSDEFLAPLTPYHWHRALDPHVLE